QAESSAPTLLEVRGVTVPGVLHEIDLEVRRGEILGIAGLVGAGRSTLLRALAGAEPTSSGTLHVEGKAVSWPRSVRAARRLGTGLIPEDRKGQGLVMSLSASDKVAIS